MKPGRELDALVAEKVMGLEVISSPDRYFEIAKQGGDFFGEKYVCTILCHNDTFPRQLPWSKIAIIPSYSTDIAAAMEVVKKMQEIEYALILDNMHWSLGNWQAHFERDKVVYAAESCSPAHAICLAALKAKGVEV